MCHMANTWYTCGSQVAEIRAQTFECRIKNIPKNKLKSFLFARFILKV